MTPFSPARNFPQNKSKTFRCEFRLLLRECEFRLLPEGRARQSEAPQVVVYHAVCRYGVTIVSQLIAQTRPLFQDASVGNWAVHVREELQKANDSAHRGQGE